MNAPAKPKPPAVGKADTPRIEKKVAWIRWQKPMVGVLWATAPMVLGAIYFFGWRSLAILLVCNAVGYGVEWSFTRSWKEPVSSAVFVTGTLLALSLPPTLPLWMAALGAAFGVLFGKMVFGGFGRNVFNPALTGRAFVYVSFGQQMTGQWAAPYGWAGGGTLVERLLGGFAKWGYTTSAWESAIADQADALTTATPSSLMKLAEYARNTTWLGQLRGLTLGEYPSVIGDASILLVLLGGIYLLWNKTANYRIVVGGLIGFAIAQTLAWWLGWKNAADPITGLFSGSILLGLLFYATDPVSASSDNLGRWVYGGMIAFMAVMIATFSVWPAGMMFAILLANMFVPLMDNYLKKAKKNKRPVRKAPKPAAVKGGAV